VDVVVRGHHAEVSDEFREQVEEKLAKASRLDPFLQRVDVEVTKEANPRLADRAYRVELTCRCKGPVVRAEAAAEDQRAALDLAVGKLESRLRRAAERRIDRKRHATGLPLAEVDPATNGAAPAVDVAESAAWSVPDDGPMIVREKSHRASAMTLDQALYEMELVGHDFFLFVDVGSGRPSVVYRRRAYDYGVIRLELAASG
jgi:ribosomal subunit interface protein